MAWMRNASPLLSPRFSPRPRRLAILIFTAILTGLVVFTSTDILLLPLPPSSIPLVPSSPFERQELQTVRTKSDNNIVYTNHSSPGLQQTYKLSSTLTTGKKTRPEETLMQCSIITKKNELSRSLVSIDDFYSPKSRCKHNFRSSVVFFHVGKAGGGTAMVQLAMKHRTRLTFVHPKPNRQIVQALKSLAENTPDTLIINIRDPIDRFVSAFQWRLLRMCAPDDTREKVKRGGAQMVDQVCEVAPEENNLLRGAYGGNPSVMAEALCDGSKRRTRAMLDIRKMSHSTKLVEWLDFLIAKGEVANNSLYNKTNKTSLHPPSASFPKLIGISDFMAIPLEKQMSREESSLEKHIEHLAHTLLAKKYGKEAVNELLAIAQTSQIQTSEKSTVARTAKAKTKNKIGVKDKMKHSASTYTGHKTIPPLTPLGECCLARYFEEDYQLIQSMLVTPSSDDGGSVRNNDNSDKAEKTIIEPLINVHPILHGACAWGEESHRELCQSDLLSILSRRAKYLNQTMGRCSDIVSKT